jgi:hypothetical protein
VTHLEDLARAVVLLQGVGAPAGGGDDAEGARGVHEDPEVVRVALGGGLEYPDGVIEEAAHDTLFGRDRQILK